MRSRARVEVEESPVPWFSSARRWGVRFDEAPQGGPRAVEGARIAEQPPVMMRGEHDPKQIEGELPGIGVGFEVPLIDGEADCLGDRAAKLALASDQQIAHRAGTIVVFDGCCEDETAPPQIVAAFDRGEPVRGEGLQAWQTTGLF